MKNAKLRVVEASPASEMPEEILEAARRLPLTLPDLKMRQNLTRDIDALLGNEKLVSFWIECRDAFNRHRRWQLLGDDGRRAALAFFFMRLLLILSQQRFPSENIGTIRTRRRKIAKQLKQIQSAIENDEDVASVNVMKFLPGYDQLGAEEIRRQPSFRFDQFLRSVTAAIEAGSLSVVDLLRLNSRMPQAGRGSSRRRLYIRGELNRLFYDCLGTHGDRLVATALQTVLGIQCSAEMVKAWRKGRGKRG